jgi:ribosomal protein S18 acetylase RimI-like enzyme
MRQRDLPRTATISAEAFKNDGFFNYICPGLHEYPDDFRAFFLRSQRKRMSQKGFVIYVAETEDSDPEGQKVVGAAFWERFGKSKAAKSWQRPNSGPVKALERSLQYLEDRYFTLFIGDRSADKKRIAEFFASLEDSFPEEAFKEYWQLQVLIVDPLYQGRGVGSMLTKWGLERAREERCCATLEASVPGLPMYKKLGFQVTKIVPGDPDKGSEPVPIMVWQPEDSEEDWVGKAQEYAQRKSNEH